MDNWNKTPLGKTRARGAGISFDGNPGKLNAITDVEGVSVGYSTLIEGDSIRTGVTGILTRPAKDMATPVYAGCHSLNGNGELTGTIWMEEAGRCDGPITITNTHSCGTARDASIKWMVKNVANIGQWALPVAGETYDGLLNDINGFHIKDEHVFEALDQAAKSSGAAIEEGSVGGGTGMVCYEYKGGSGTASRVLDIGDRKITVGAFVQANFGLAHQLQISGVPVGKLLAKKDKIDERGSIIAIIATDAPLLPHQLKRLARRVSLGLGRSGAISGHGSGDIFMAFSTANAESFDHKADLVSVDLIPNPKLDPIFEAVIQATDEAIMNAIFANETMQGINGRIVEALPHDQVAAIMKEYKQI